MRITEDLKERILERLGQYQIWFEQDMMQDFEDIMSSDIITKRQIFTQIAREFDVTSRQVEGIYCRNFE